MLLEFKVGNFLSFCDIQTFSLRASKVRSHNNRVFRNNQLKLLKFAAIYGANASGKSNFIDSLSFFQSLVGNGIPNKSSQLYCKCSEINRDKTTYFEITTLIKKKIIVYGIELNLYDKEIIREWIYDATSESSTKEILNRNVKNSEYAFDLKTKDIKLKTRIEIYAEDIKSDTSMLFLQSMNKNKEGLYSSFNNEPDLSLFRQLYRWIKYNLSVNYADRPITSYSSLIESGNFDSINRLLKGFGTGIESLEVADVPIEDISIEIPHDLMEDIIASLEKNLEKDNEKVASILLRTSEKSMYIFDMDKDSNINCRTIRFSHTNSTSKFSLAEESDGTLRLLDLLEVLLSSKENTVYVIDEINRCLHPNLTYEFIKQYLEFVKDKNIQLIVTTHESKLMDFDLLRRDEIWFINKNESGTSQIYSLEKHNARFDKKVIRSYFEGDYGAIPKFNINEFSES